MNKSIKQTQKKSFNKKYFKVYENDFKREQMYNQEIKRIQNFIDNLIDPKIKNFISHQEQFDLMSACFSAEKSVMMNKKIKIKYL